MQALVGEIRVDGRARIVPTYVLQAGLHHRPGQYPQGESNPRYQRERLAC